MANCRNKFRATVQTSCNCCALRCILRQLPWLCRLDIRICLVGQFHDQSHGTVVIALFVGGSDIVACGRGPSRTAHHLRDKSRTGLLAGRTSHSD